VHAAGWLSRAAANTITRKRTAFHGALGYAVELGLLPADPLGLVRWHAPAVGATVNPATVASPAQVQTILAQVARLRPERHVRAYAGGKVKSLVSTDASAISIIRCPSGWSDFMFSRAQVIKNAPHVGIAKTSECTRAWCTVTVSAAI
jgi:hypothetical protein